MAKITSNLGITVIRICGYVTHTEGNRPQRLLRHKFCIEQNPIYIMVGHRGIPRAQGNFSLWVSLSFLLMRQIYTILNFVLEPLA